MNHVNLKWVRRKNVWASRKYIMQKFIDPRESSGQSFREQLNSWHVSLEASQVTQWLRNFSWLKILSKKQKARLWICLSPCSVYHSSPLSLFLFLIRTAIITFWIKEFIFLWKKCCFHLCSASTLICKITFLYKV